MYTRFALLIVLLSFFSVSARADTRPPFEFPPVVVGGTLIVSVPVALNGQQSAIKSVNTSFRKDSTFGIEKYSIAGTGRDTAFVDVAFRPVVTGVHTDSLVVTLESLESIVVPLFGVGLPLRVEPTRLDFGTVWEEEDTTLAYTIYNDGNSSLTVLQSQTVLPFYRSGDDEITLPALDSVRVEVHFAPGRQQERPESFFFGEIHVATSAGSDSSQVWLALLGSVRAKVVQEEILFPPLFTGLSDTVDYIFFNRFQEPLHIIIGSIDGSSAFTFTKDYGKAVEVAPGASLHIPVRFTPTERRHTAVFLISDTEEYLLDEVRLEGQGLLQNAQIVADTLHGSVGETMTIPVRFAFGKDMADVLRQTAGTTLDIVCSVAMNASMVDVEHTQVVDSVTYNNSGEIVLHISARIALPIPATGTDTVTMLAIPIRLLLGDADRSRIVIRNTVLWLGGTILFESDSMSQGDGLLIADNIFTWPDGQKRLVNVRKGPLDMEISPNPMQEETAVTISGFSGSALVTIYTPLGVELFRTSRNVSGTFTLTRTELTGVAPGIYYCRLSAGRYSLVKLLRVE